MAWKPTRDEARFIGEVFAIDAGLANLVKDALEKGHTLQSVQDSIRVAVKIAAKARDAA